MNATESATFDLPLPSRNFTATRRVLMVVLVASVLIPIFCLVAYGYYDFQRRLSIANDLVDRMSRVIDEHALKVLDINQQIETRIVDLLGDSDDGAIRAREKELYSRLGVIGGAFPQVAAISVFGRDGALIANSRYYPLPPNVSIADRDDFVSARAIAPVTYFSLPLRGKVGGADVFTTTLARISSSGQFLGVVSVALRREYFANFYREISAGDTAMTLGLYRRDGGILVRYPLLAQEVQPALNTPFTNAFRNNELYGHVRMVSTVDGADKVVAFRKVGDYPLYVASGYATSEVFGQWWRQCLLIAGFALAPCIAVWLLVVFSIRRLDSERAAWEQWQAEVANRLSMEASSRQLRRMGALGNLVANVAHDFNNLLMVVASNMELARCKQFNNVEHEVLAVERATSGAEALARRLMSVARKQPLKQEHIDPAVFLPGISDLVRSSLRGTATLSVELSPDLWTVLADPMELELALVNLAVNASEAMPRGGRLVIRCQNVRVTAGESELPNGDYVLISVSDNGEGMSDAVRQRAFEPLFTTKVQGAGTGLGLTQVLAACEQAGGTARITSVAGAGTTVRLYLPGHHQPVMQPPVEPRVQSIIPPAVATVPVVEEAAEPAFAPDQQASAAAALPAGFRAASVLLVEDNHDVAAGVAAVLEVFGCKVHHELSADAAFNLLGEGYGFDLVLSDIQMPGRMNGVDLAEQIIERLPLQRVVLMTGYADELARARDLGVRVLAKPFDMEDLRELVTPGLA